MKPAALKSRNSHSSYEKSNSGFKTFFAFGLMACVLGLSVKVFFAPERLTPLLKDELAIRLPQFQIGFKSVELVLANGVLPAFSFEIKDAEISYKKNCGVVIPPIRIQKANLPISIFKLFEIGRAHV